MAKDRVNPRPFLTVLLFVFVAVLLFGVAFGADRVFSASDSNLGWLTFKKSLMPELHTGAYRASPLMGISSLKLPVFSDTLLCLLPAQLYNDAVYAILLFGASLFFVAYLRLLKRSWSACAVGALVAFWLGSVTIAVGGHIGKFGVAFFGTAALFLIEKAVRHTGWRYLLWSVLAGGAIGGMLLEQQDVALLWGLLLGAYAIFRTIQSFGRKAWREYILIFAPIALVGLLLSGPSSMTMYQKNVVSAAAIDVQNDEGKIQKWNYVTQWSVPPADMIDVVAPGFQGWKTGDPTGPYWGEIGQSAEWPETGKGFRNFKMDNLYIGILPFLLALYALIRARRSGEAKPVVWFMGVAVALFLLLSFGRYTPFYRLFYALPLVNNIRAPVKFMQILQVALGVLAAFGVDQIFSKDDSRPRLSRWPVRMCIGTTLVFGLAAAFIAIGWQSWTQEFQKEWGTHGSIMVGNMVRALTHASILAGCGTLLVWGVRHARIRRIVPVVLMALLVTDSWMLCRRYFTAQPLKTYAAKDAALDFLQENTKDERVYLFDAGGIHNRWVGVDFLYRDINHFNIFQMPRMAKDYKQWLQTLNNPLRLMQLSSVKYASMPVQTWKKIKSQPGLIQAFRPLFYYGFVQKEPGVVVSVMVDPAQASHVMVEYLISSPRISVKSQWKVVADDLACKALASATFDPRQMTLVAPQTAEGLPLPSASGKVSPTTVVIDKKQAVAKMELDAPGIAVFTQKFAPGWKVSVDGKDQPLLRCDYLSMGVWVDKGQHEVVFRYQPRTGGAWIQVIGMILVLMAAFALFIGKMISGRVKIVTIGG